MAIKFEKWQGLGNDFIILENICATSSLATKMCDRKFGVGADGLFSAKKSQVCDIGWDFFNADGTTAEMCGNGMRCFAKYVFEKGLVKSKKFTVETLAGVITPEILDNGFVRVDMGNPVFESQKIPVNVDRPLDFEIEGYRASALSMGNPHCVIVVESDSGRLAREVGPKIEASPLFPEKVNVEFIEILSKDKIKLNVWERGCGITLACGTGACAAVVAGIKKGLLESKVTVELPGGQLVVEYYGEGARGMENEILHSRASETQGGEASYGESVFMSGDAQKVFIGEFFA